ncbi:hypothetical protein Hanom_Chr12g01163501 [Helianthus anomalus]
MEEANLARKRTEESARKDLQAKDVALAKVNQRLVGAEVREDAEGARAAKAEEDYQRVLAQHTTSSVQLEDEKALNADLDTDRQWMHDYEVDDAVVVLRAKVHDGGYKAAYTECLTHVNAMSKKKFTDEQCRAREIDTKGELKAASDAYNTLIVPILAQVEEYLAADDYVDRLRELFEPEADAEWETESEV